MFQQWISPVKDLFTIKKTSDFFSCFLLLQKESDLTMLADIRNEASCMSFLWFPTQTIRKSRRNSTMLILIDSTCLRQLYLIDSLQFISASINERNIFYVTWDEIDITLSLHCLRKPNQVQCESGHDTDHLIRKWVSRRNSPRVYNSRACTSLMSRLFLNALTVKFLEMCMCLSDDTCWKTHGS